MVEDTERLDGGERVRIRRPSVRATRYAGPVPTSSAGRPSSLPGPRSARRRSGVLASVNRRRRRRSIPRPRVAVLSTGDELVDDGGPLRPGQIRESNRVMLLAAIEPVGVRGRSSSARSRDDEDALEAVLRAAVEQADAVVTSGGVSMGDYDVVKAVLDRIAEMRWMQIAIKPAKPFAFGTLWAGDGRTVPIFGLPGNPVSSLVSFELLARPGAAPDGRARRRSTDPIVQAVADEPFRRRPDGKTHYVRVHGAFADRRPVPRPDHRCAGVAPAGRHRRGQRHRGRRRRDGVAAGDPFGRSCSTSPVSECLVR